jgi:Glycosyl hydrolase-like 10
MNRRQFLASSIVAGCALQMAPFSFGADQKSSDSDKLILSAPLTHSDWMLKAGIPWGMEGVKHMLDACKACGWSRVYWRALDGGRSLYKSKLMRPQGKWDEDNFWNPKSEADKVLLQHFTPNMTPEQRTALRNKFEALDYAHFDSLAAAVEYGHQIGLQIHAWVSINEDDHGWGIQSEYSKKHPEFRWHKRKGTAYHSQLSFAYPEVRKYKLAILKELLANYKLDGIFLDWIRTGDVRDNPQTDAEGVADSGYEEPLVKKFKKQFGIDPHEVTNSDERWVKLRAEPQTEFMREVKKLMRAQKRQIPLSLMVGHPWHYRGEMNKIDGNLRGLLLDVATWAREGLMDSVVAAGYYRDGGNAEMAYKALQKESGDAVNVWTYGWVPQTVSDFERDFGLAKSLGARQILFWEADYIDDRAQKSELQKAMSLRSSW